MEPITIKGRINFTDKKFKVYSRNFVATLHDSAAFTYGNQTSVCIEWGPMKCGTIPGCMLIYTRYDRTIKRTEADFKIWLETYFKEHLRTHTLIFYQDKERKGGQRCKIR